MPAFPDLFIGGSIHDAAVLAVKQSVVDPVGTPDHVELRGGVPQYE